MSSGDNEAQSSGSQSGGDDEGAKEGEENLEIESKDKNDENQEKDDNGDEDDDENDNENEEFNNLIERIKMSPGCRIKGEFTELAKTKAELLINFNDNFSLYSMLQKIDGIDLNLNYKINEFVLGERSQFSSVLEALTPYHKNALEELNPAVLDPPHNNGNFVARHNIKIFPVEFKSDYTPNQTLTTFQFTFAKKFEQLETPGIDYDHTDNILFELEFMPLVRIYHVEVFPLWTFFWNLISTCGGMFGLMEVISYLINRNSK
jgi:hypothetical protein